MDRKKVDPRLYEVTNSLIKHLHGFIKEVEPTNDGVDGRRSSS